MTLPHLTHLHDCPAPAKLNLFLHVVGRRPDGYHLLQTVFQLLDHCDALDFTLRRDPSVRRINEVPGVLEDEDLVVRAARLLQQATGCTQGVEVKVRKRLPMGGGLGGGSSDAATTLIALNRLWGLKLSRAELMRIGLQLGADVPFFVFGRNAFAEGVGEELQPVDLPDRWFVVVEPGVSVPTPSIFRAPQLTRDTKMVTIADFSRSPKGFGKNDLQAVATAQFPAIADALHALGENGEARMTGSGACIFRAFDDEAAADRMLSALDGRWRSWKARGLARHPLDGLRQS